MSTSATKRRRLLTRAYVPTTALAKTVEFTDEMMQVVLTDGRVLGAPLIWFRALREASPAQRANYVIGAEGRGIHWPDIDEDLSVAGLMAGVDHQAA